MNICIFKLLSAKKNFFYILRFRLHLVRRAPHWVWSGVAKGKPWPRVQVGPTDMADIVILIKIYGTVDPWSYLPCLDRWLEYHKVYVFVSKTWVWCGATPPFIKWNFFTKPLCIERIYFRKGSCKSRQWPSILKIEGKFLLSRLHCPCCYLLGMQRFGYENNRIFWSPKLIILLVGIAIQTKICCVEIIDLSSSSPFSNILVSLMQNSTRHAIERSDNSWWELILYGCMFKNV